MDKVRELLVVRRHKLNGAVVVGESVLSSIDELTIVLAYDGEVFIASVNTHHVLHGISVGLRQCAVAMPVSYDVYFHKLVHQLWQFDIVFQNTRRILERIIVMVGSVLFSELFEEFAERKVNSFCAICEIGETIISLSFCIDDLITSLLNKVCLILPQVVRLLRSTVATEDTRTIQLDIVIEEALRSHSLVVTIRNLIIIRHFKLTTLIS